MKSALGPDDVWPVEGSQFLNFFWFSLCGCSAGTQTKTALVIMIEPGSLGKHLYTLTVPKNVHLHTRQHT